jgi:tRNA (guanine-N7-)-methyltransferase
MPPFHLKIPYGWKAPKVMIEEGIFYVPDRCESYDAFTFPGWQDPSLFGNNLPLRIEYCSGNGAWLVEKALAHPEINWVGVEKKFKRVKKIRAKAKKLNLKNLIVVYGEAYLATSRYFPVDTFEAAYINFPDPWPKNRHAKNRLIQPKFIDEVWRILKPAAAFTLVTDDPEYSWRMLEEMGGHRGFRSCLPDPFFITEMPGYGSSYFDQLWREKGKTIRYHQFEKLCQTSV